MATMTVYDEAFIARFWAKVAQVEDPEACWPWIGSRDNVDGRGHLKYRGKLALAPRVSWMLAGHEIPNEFDVLHTCDVPACVRNDDQGVYMVNGIARLRLGHLWVGTHADNMADKVAKGRHVGGWPIGERHHSAKLTFPLAEEIRRRYSGGGVSHRALATEFNVSPRAIWQVLTGRTWKSEAAS